MLRRLSVVVVAAVLGACGGKAADDGVEPGTGGAAGAGGSVAAGGAVAVGGGTSVGGASGSGGSGGGSAGSGGSGGGECVPKGDGWNSDPNPGCDDLDVLAIESPTLVDDGGDGSVSPGEGFSLKVVLREVAGVGFGMYPGVKFESDQPGVSVQENDWYYGIFACASYDASAKGQVDASVKPGTVVTLTARAAMLNTDCPGAPALKIQLTVK